MALDSALRRDRRVSSFSKTAEGVSRDEAGGPSRVGDTGVGPDHSSSRTTDAPSPRPAPLAGNRLKDNTQAQGNESSDQLSPWPKTGQRAHERPKIDRSATLPNRPKHQSRSSGSILGLSELLSTPPLSTAAETSYFGADLDPPGSPSYNADEDADDEDSSPRPDERERRKSADPPGSVRSAGPSPPAQPELASPTLSQSSSTDTKSRSPRIKNSGVLAPHGSFTSARARGTPTPPPRGRTFTASSDSQLYLGVLQRACLASHPDPGEREALLRAAAKGDQLALYRLGMRTETLGSQRYRIGTVENVWGSSEYQTSTVRSIKSSHSATSRSTSLSKVTPPIITPDTPDGTRSVSTDLFDDAARLAVRPPPGVKSPEPTEPPPVSIYRR